MDGLLRGRAARNFLCIGKVEVFVGLFGRLNIVVAVQGKMHGFLVGYFGGYILWVAVRSKFS